MHKLHLHFFLHVTLTFLHVTLTFLHVTLTFLSSCYTYISFFIFSRLILLKHHCQGFMVVRCVLPFISKDPENQPPCSHSSHCSWTSRWVCQNIICFSIVVRHIKRYIKVNKVFVNQLQQFCGNSSKNFEDSIVFYVSLLLLSEVYLEWTYNNKK